MGAHQTLAKKMNILTHITLTTLLLLTTHPLSAEDKNIEQAKSKVEIKKDIPKNVVYVTGAVQRPGPIEYREGVTIYSMIMAAGGPSKLGTLARVSVYRDGTRRIYNLSQKEMQSAILAKPNDTCEVHTKYFPAG